MADERRSGAGNLSPLAAAPTSTLPYPIWALLALGACACIGWLGATALVVWAPSVGLLPAWLRLALRTLLVLATPAFIMLFVRSPRMPARRHALALFSAEALLLLVVAIPSLLPYATPSDLIGLPLRVSTPSLGVALAVVDPLIAEQGRRNRNRDYSTMVAALIGFGLALVVVAAVLLLGINQSGCTGQRFPCGALIAMAQYAVCGELLGCLITALLGGLLGYALGAWIARSDRWT